jgi:hypothetical protein
LAQPARLAELPDSCQQALRYVVCHARR